MAGSSGCFDIFGSPRKYSSVTPRRSRFLARASKGDGHDRPTCQRVAPSGPCTKYSVEQPCPCMRFRAQVPLFIAPVPGHTSLYLGEYSELRLCLPSARERGGVDEGEPYELRLDDRRCRWGHSRAGLLEQGSPGPRSLRFRSILEGSRPTGLRIGSISRPIAQQTARQSHGA
jgi:hypothetical protein